MNRPYWHLVTPYQIYRSSSTKIRFRVGWHGGERHQTGQGACFVRFAGQIIFRTVKGADGITTFQRTVQRTSYPRAIPSAWGAKILYLDASKRMIQITDEFLDGMFLRIKEGSESSSLEHLRAVWCAELSIDGLVKTPLMQSFSAASVKHTGDLCQMTNHLNQGNRDLPPPVMSHPNRVVFTSEIQSSCPDTDTPRDALAVKQQ